MKKDAAAAAASNQPFLYQLETTQQRYNYFNSKSILDLHKHDVPMALMEAGCSHLSIKIFQYLDSASLLAASLVCLDWQQVKNILSLESFTGALSLSLCFFMEFINSFGLLAFLGENSAPKSSSMKSRDHVKIVLRTFALLPY